MCSSFVFLVTKPFQLFQRDSALDNRQLFMEVGTGEREKGEFGEFAFFHGLLSGPTKTNFLLFSSFEKEIRILRFSQTSSTRLSPIMNFGLWDNFPFCLPVSR